MNQDQWKLHFEKGNLKEALVAINDILDVQPNHTPLIHQKGLILARMGDYKDAIGLFDECIAFEPSNADFVSDKAILLYKLGKSDEAISYFDKAVSLEPQNPYRYSSRAFIKSNIGNLQGAISDYNIAIELDPEDLVAHNNLGLVYEKLGQTKKSKESFAKADQNTNQQEVNTPLLNIERENYDQKTTDKPLENYHKGTKSILAVLKQVFTTRAGFSDFLTYVKTLPKSK